MPYTVLHLRWSDVAPDACEKARVALDGSAPVPGGCLSRDLRRHGTALLDTEVWADGAAALRFASRLPEIVAPAGLGHPSHVASYVLLDVLVGAYARRGRGPGFLAHPVDLGDGVAAVARPATPAVARPVIEQPAAPQPAAPQLRVAAALPEPRRPADRERVGVR